jgi:hypothetical protein
MANGAVHVEAGLVVGGAAAFASSADRTGYERLVEVIGGVLAGRAGAMLPDRIDPPTHPRHRSLGHGVLPNIGIWSYVLSHAHEFQELLRSKAAEQRQARDWAQCWWEKLCCLLLELGYLLLSGGIVGLPAGYVSHLALDSFTPCGLPLLA